MIQLQLNNINSVIMVAWLLYDVFEILLQLVFQIWFIISR